VELIFSCTLTGLKYYGNWIHSPNTHVSIIWMQSLSKTLKPLKHNQSVWSKTSLVFNSLQFFLRLSVWLKYSFRTTEMFLWKAWMYRLVTLYSHDHLLFDWPQKLSEETCYQKKSKNSFQPIFKSLNVIVGFYTDKLSMQEIVSSLFPFSLDIVGNLIRWKRLCD